MAEIEAAARPDASPRPRTCRLANEQHVTDEVNGLGGPGGRGGHRGLLGEDGQRPTASPTHRQRDRHLHGA